MTAMVSPLATPTRPLKTIAATRVPAFPSAAVAAAVTSSDRPMACPARAMVARTVSSSDAAVAPMLKALAIHPMPEVDHPRSSASSTSPAPTGPLKHISLSPTTVISGRRALWSRM
nr:hypothetical protein [Mangrovihabitans endophyticus]